MKAAASKDILLNSSSNKIGGANGTGPIAEVEPQDEWILSIETRVMAMKTREQKRRSEALRKRRAILESQKKQDTQFERWEKIAERASESENGNGNLISSTATGKAAIKKRILKTLAKGQPQDQQ